MKHICYKTNMALLRETMPSAKDDQYRYKCIIYIIYYNIGTLYTYGGVFVE